MGTCLYLSLLIPSPSSPSLPSIRSHNPPSTTLNLCGDIPSVTLSLSLFYCGADISCDFMCGLWHVCGHVSVCSLCGHVPLLM